MFKIRKSTLTKESGLLQLSQSYVHVLLYGKTSRKYRDKIRYIFRRLGIVSHKANEKGIASPVHENISCEGKYTDAWDVYIPTVHISTFIAEYADTLDMDADKPFVGMEKIFHQRIPMGMGKLSPMSPANSRCNPFPHATGELSPNNRDTTIVHGRIARKMKSKPTFKRKLNGNYLFIERGKGIGKRGRRFVFVDRNKQ